MKVFLIILFLLPCKFVFSQTLIPEAAKIKRAYEKFSINKYNNEFQKEYITAFPSDTKTFLKIFATKNFDQLYKYSDKYLEALELCANNFPKEVIGKSIEIAKNLVWDADAVGELQKLSIRIDTKYIHAFINKYNSLKSKEQNNLIKFYADVENFNAYHEFQDLIDKLKLVGQTDISKKLEIARIKRKKG